MVTNSSDYLDVSSSGAIIWGDGIDDSYYVALYHAYVIDVAVLLCQLQEVLDEVHDVGAGVHVILWNCQPYIL